MLGSGAPVLPGSFPHGAPLEVRQGGVLSGQSWQPLAGGNNDIILEPTRRARSMKWLFVAIGVSLILVVCVGVLLIRQSPQYVDGDVLAVMQEHGLEITDAQLILFSLNYEFPRDYVRGLFSNDYKLYLDRSFAAIPYFVKKLNEIDVSMMRSDLARELFIELRDGVNRDEWIYLKTIGLYDLFYEYINNGFDALYKDQIIAYSESSSDLLAQVDAWNDIQYEYVPANFVSNLFSAFISDDYVWVDYENLIGRITAILKDHGGEHEN